MSGRQTFRDTSALLDDNYLRMLLTTVV